MNVAARARRVFLVIPLAALAAFACSRPVRDDSRTATQTQASGVPPRCTLNPWDTGAIKCGTLTTLPARTTCADRGFVGPNVTITVTPDANGSLGSVSGDLGVTTGVGTITVGNPPDAVTDLIVASTVNPDGTTMTFDGIVVAGGALDASEVLRFDTPEFYVENIPMLDPTTTIELCDYKQGHSLGVPPPTQAGAVKVTCGFMPGEPGVAGSATAPGPTITSLSEARWYVTVDPAPPDPARLVYSIAVDGTVKSQGNNVALTNGSSETGLYGNEVSGDDYDLAITLSYGLDSCTLYWHVDAGSGASDAGSSSSSGQAW